MPLSRYSRYFGGQKDAPARVLANMKREYGDRKGTEIFYRTVNKRRAARERGRGLTKTLRDRRKT